MNAPTEIHSPTWTRLRAIGNGLPATGHGKSHHCSLFVTRCSLFVPRCSLQLFAVHCSLLIATAFAQPAVRINRIDLSWPTVSLTVRAACGSQLRTDADRTNFAIAENARPVTDFIVTPVDTLPPGIQAVLLFDRSGSMGQGTPPLLDVAKQGFREFLHVMDSVRHPADRAALISFTVMPEVDFDFTGDTGLLRSGIDSIEAEGNSAIYDACAFSILQFMGRDTTNGSGILLISDGMDGASQQSADNVIALAQAYHIRIFVIGIGAGTGDPNLVRIAAESGGKFFTHPWPEVMHQIYQEIWSGPPGRNPNFRIDYLSAGCMDGVRRTVELTLKGLAGCPGSDSDADYYRPPRDSSTFTPISIRAGTGSIAAGDTARLPLVLETGVNTIFDRPSFKVLFDPMMCTCVGYTAAGALLDGLPLVVNPVSNGVRITSTGSISVNGSGELMSLKFVAADPERFGRVPVAPSQWTFSTGCLLPLLSGGELRVNGPLRITSLDGGDTLCAGSSKTITWWKSGIAAVDVDLSNDFGATFSIPLAAGVTDTFFVWNIPPAFPPEGYRLRIKESGGARQAIGAGTFAIYPPTAILVQPSDIVAKIGEKAEISVGAAGGRLIYQWMKSGIPLPGETKPFITFPGVKKSDEGFYSVLVGGLCGPAVISDSASLLVTEVGVEEERAGPRGIELLQNYPNPVPRTREGAWTTISYRLTRPGPVRLTIRDLLGRPAAVILDDREDAGWHAIRFDTSPLHSGIYLYRLEGEGVIATRKMVVVK